jgi:hypothetical protein
MPNWCMNNLTIEGKPERLNQLADAIEKGEFFQHVKPIGNWDYENALNSWGTKWDIGENTVDFPEDNMLSVVFDTAWSPPLGVYEALMEDPDIDSVYGSYFEPGMNFGGEWDNGDDRYVGDINEAFKDGDEVAIEINEQYEFDSWFEEEEEELSMWMDQGMQEKNLKKEVDTN